ncbi:hypothetical protein K6U06_13960 [Acidiferrimicrobium sp. IK]|uniref:hypothetical protein n=1 Tax=Acidiferrimicrobium sp. IK TaxID=2871700 RepID=UPI0021CB5E52|nr:hypothetical protein [Acidiferrimicrobium sp. IK]MCU4185474.1 hypothetical protein [Acidiferrimicrobium sp. IK]
MRRGESPGIIDGDAWRRRRLDALREALTGDLDAEQRAAIELELVELGALEAGARRRRRRWLLWGARLPGR